jgi:DNA repair protein SbcD/Mre11
VRILHFADVHLDRPLKGLGLETAKRRRLELFSAFQRCLRVAVERDVDLITIGGDLWEEEHVRPDTRNSVAYELGRLEIPVLICCGNHDPLLAGGSWRQTEWPEKVQIAPLRTLTEHPFDSTSIWSVSWGGGELSPRLLDHFDVPTDARTHLLLIHGTSINAPFASDEDFEGYLPFDPARVRDSGFSLCLAGHIHDASDVAGVVYPGSPEPLGWAETGRHCVAFLEVANGQAQVELIDVNEKRYETREVDCSGCRASSEVQDRIDSALDDSDAEKIFVRLRLVGDVNPDCEIDVNGIVAAHRDRYATLNVEDRTEPVLDLDRRAARKGLDGSLVKELRNRLENAESDRERRVVELALQAGLRALDGREPILRVD